MGKYKKLFRNLGILTIGQFGSKILVFLLVPLYTSILSTEEYGAYDLIYTTVNLLFPIVTLNIAVSVQRFLLDPKPNRDGIVLTGVKFSTIGLGFILLCTIINHFIIISRVIYDNEICFLLLYIVLSYNSLFIEVAIGNDKIHILTISGVLSTVVMILSNVLLLLVFKMGLTGYFVANILGPLVQIIFLTIKLDIIKKYRVDRSLKKNDEKCMLQYSVPHIANTIAWWVNNASDRYIVTWFCGIAVNGIYSVGYKIPSILNVVQNIFGQAWGISAVKNFDSKDDDGFFLKTYNLYNTGMIVSCSFIIAFTKVIARFMYAKDFYDAWYYSPMLLIASVFGAMSGFLGGIFGAKKEAKVFAKSTVIGAITNVILNFFLVYLFGAIGAAIATLISYFVVWLFRLIHAKRFIVLQIPLLRDSLSYVLLLAQAIIIMVIDNNNIVLYIIEAILVALIFVVRYRDFRLILSKLSKKRGSEEL